VPPLTQGLNYRTACDVSLSAVAVLLVNKVLYAFYTTKYVYFYLKMDLHAFGGRALPGREGGGVGEGVKS